MKKIYLVLVFLAFTALTFAQLQVNPNPVKPHLTPANEAKVPVATLTYCTDVVATSVGMNADAEFGVFVSFPGTMMTPYVGNIINQVPIGVTQLANIASLEIRIFEDTTGAGAGGGTPVAVQTVDVASLIDGWNNIDLTTPYTVTGNEIFVGYWIHTTTGFPCSASNNAVVDPEGGWVCDPAGWGSLNAYGLAYNWQIKAVVDDGTVVSADAGVTAFDAPFGCTLTAAETCTATVENFGTDPITAAFNIAYELNGGAVVTVPVPVPLAAGASIDVTFDIDMSVPGTFDFVVYTQLAGDGYDGNDTSYLLTANIPPSAVPYASGFDDAAGQLGWVIENTNGDANFWNFYASVGVGGTNAIGYLYSSTTAADDYIFSTCLDLVADDYDVSFAYAAYDAGYAENLNVFWGDAQNSAAMTNLIVDLPGVVNTDFLTSTTTITIPTDGIYYVGFHCYSPADMYVMIVDDFAIDFATDVKPVVAGVVSIYPNPTTGLVKVENAKSIVVYNMIGEVVTSVNNANALTTIDLSTFGNGSYIVKVNDGANVITKKINLIK